MEAGGEKLGDEEIENVFSKCILDSFFFNFNYFFQFIDKYFEKTTECESKLITLYPIFQKLYPHFSKEKFVGLVGPKLKKKGFSQNNNKEWNLKASSTASGIYLD